MNRRGFFGRLPGGVAGACAGESAATTAEPEAAPPLLALTCTATADPEQPPQLREQWELLNRRVMSVSEMRVPEDGFTVTPGTAGRRA